MISSEKEDTFKIKFFFYSLCSVSFFSGKKEKAEKRTVKKLFFLLYENFVTFFILKTHTPQ
jgi:hypothetical protein